MGRSRMGEERINVISAIANKLILLLKLKDQPGGIFRNFDQEDFVNDFSRLCWSCIALGDEAERYIASHFRLGLRKGVALYHYIEVAFENCLCLVCLHRFKINTKQRDLEPKLVRVKYFQKFLSIKLQQFTLQVCEQNKYPSIIHFSIVNYESIGLFSQFLSINKEQFVFGLSSLKVRLHLRFYLQQIVMSHLRDIQRLRQTKNIEPFILPVRSTQNRPAQVYNINFDKIAEIQQRSNGNNQSSKYVLSRETSANRERRSSHSRGVSNSTNEPDSPGISTQTMGYFRYNFALKASQKGETSVSSRRQNNLSTNQFESNQIQMISTSRMLTKKQKLPQEITVQHFQPVYPIGKGGFGKVWKVQIKKTRQIFAMKKMYKAKIIQKKSINSVMNERNLLSRVHHSFFINMTYAFQDRQNLYLIMDYVNGGDLRYHIGRRRRFTQLEAKFFIANLIIGLEYLYRNRIIHRDIKPQNLVLDSKGYIRITDLGVSRQFKEENFQDTSGTPGYMAPEVMCRKNHSYTADYFAVGVMAHEFMLGKRPYVGRSRNQIRDQILSKQAAVKIEELPNRWSLDAADFINQLLQRNPNNRLGAGGIEQLKRHEWMKNVDFARLERKQLKAPYIPASIQQNYEDYKGQISQDTLEDNFEENLLILRDQEVQGLFEGYEYDNNTPLDKRKGFSITS